MTDDKTRAKAMKTAVKFKGNNDAKTIERFRFLYFLLNLNS